VSPTSTARNSSTLRKIALCGAAIVVTLLPTACGAAYADSGHAGHSGEVVKVGQSDATEPSSDQADGQDAADKSGDENAGDQNAGDQNADDQNASDQNAGDQNADAAQDKGKNKDQNGAGKGQGADKGQGDEKGKGAENGKGKGGIEDNNGLDVLGRDCSNSKLEPHNGFQEAPRCVSTAFGEVAAADKSPSLLITDSPQTVKAGQEFTISVSTRNLVRDRFLGAAAGGYYLESSFLNADGIQRGHFHTACRMLDSTSEAPDASPDPEFFLATQDNGGGAAPDTVKITVTGMPSAGTAQCAVWAGDGSHRIPMMQRANQTPAFDAVRIKVE
jgi:hypothetical protein